MVRCKQMSLLKRDGLFTQNLGNPREGTESALTQNSPTWVGNSAPYQTSFPVSDDSLRTLSFTISSLKSVKYYKHTDKTGIMVSIKEEDGQYPQQHT